MGTTTARIVVSEDQPFGHFVTAHADHRRAEELRLGGAMIEIATEAEIRSRLVG